MEMIDLDYRFFVTTNDCLFCGKGGVNEPHHLRDKSGWSRKPPDYCCISLCGEHHALIHGDPELFETTVSTGEMALEVVRLLNKYSRHNKGGYHG